MTDNYQIDDVDKKILRHLLADARKPFLEIARDLIVSGGTIHQRVNRMTEAGIIKGSKVTIDRQKLGLDVTVLLGIHLQSAKGNQHVIEKLKTFPEVIEAYYTTGNYALIAKICVANIKEFHLFLSQKLQAMEEIQSTESFICLDQPIERDVEVL